jgi:hypothetical protein
MVHERAFVWIGMLDDRASAMFGNDTKNGPKYKIFKSTIVYLAYTFIPFHADRERATEVQNMGGFEATIVVVNRVKQSQ